MSQPAGIEWRMDVTLHSSVGLVAGDMLSHIEDFNEIRAHEGNN